MATQGFDSPQLHKQCCKSHCFLQLNMPCRLIGRTDGSEPSNLGSSPSEAICEFWNAIRREIKVINDTGYSLIYWWGSIPLVRLSDYFYVTWRENGYEMIETTSLK